MSLITLTALAASFALQTAEPQPQSARETAPQVASTQSDSTVSATDPAEPPLAPLTWEQLPEPLRVNLEKALSIPPTQAVLNVETPVAADTEFRTLDHGVVLSEQIVRPAEFVTIATPARNARKYGPAGAALWAGVGDDADWWCWRNTDRYPNWIMPSDIYCYRDTDGDGDFDVTMENDVPELNLGKSRFQFTELGHDERLKDVVTYTPGGHADFSEKVVIRYDGPGSARVGADGRLVDGVVLFQLLTGPGVLREAASGNILIRPAQTEPDDGLDLVAPLMVRLDQEGRGRYADERGIVIEVDRVDSDGRARAKLVSALPAGRTLLFRPPSREELLELYARFIRPAQIRQAQSK